MARRKKPVDDRPWEDRVDWDQACRSMASSLKGQDGPSYVDTPRSWTKAELKAISRLDKMSRRKKPFDREEFPAIVTEVADLNDGLWKRGRKHDQTFKAYFSESRTDFIKRRNNEETSD